MGGVRLDASDAHHARESLARGLEFVPNGIVEVHDLAGTHLQEQSGLGRRHAFPGALKELCAVFALEFLYALGERRLRDVQALGSAGEAACFDNGQKCPQAADVHGSGPKMEVARVQTGGVSKRLPFFIIPHGPVCGRWPHQEGQQIVKIDTFYASSKTCSACGHKLETLSLATRNWTCPALRRSS